MSTSMSIPTLSNTHATHNDSNNARSVSIPSRPRPRLRPRPRQLLDLPDEILCLILAYCSQDLDILLWSCPLITADGQFCHDCYHCSLCHGPLRQTKQLGTTASASHNTRSKRLRGFVFSSNTNRLSDYNNMSTAGGGNTNSNRVADNSNGNSSTSESIVRKRRRRLAAAEEREDQLNFTAHDRAFNFLRLSLGRKGSQLCPHSVQQQWSDHPGPHQRRQPSSHYQDSSSFWSRHLPRRTTSLHHHPPLPPNQSILPSTPSTSFASAAFSFISRRAQNQEKRLIEGGSESKATVIPGGSSISAEESPLPELKPLSRTSPHHAFTREQPWDQGTGHFESLAQELQSMHAVVSHANRRRARSMTLNSSVTLEGRNVSFPSKTYMDGLIPSVTPQIASSSPSAIANNNTNTVETQGRTISSGNDRIDDEYTDSIELSAPFQLLLVNRRFADIAVRSLWKGIVFHGHDSFQVQALLSTLHGGGGTTTSNQPVVSQTDASCLGLDIVKDNNPVKSTPALLSVLDENEPTQVRSSTLVDSVQQSVKRFNGVRYPAQTTAVLSDDQQQQREQVRMPSSQDRSGVLRRHSTTGVEPARSPASQSHSPTNLQSPVLMPRWSYRQMPRNIVLNFSHPQASPHLLVSVLECIGSRCRDQVRALDLRANEKMQAAGLETSSELERLFGSGFSRLQYLRLQGGFVDNQLLGALTKGIISATSLPASSEATASQERRLQQELQQQQQQTGLPMSLHMTPPCRLSQVFLGPGSVTDSAIAKLIVAASHCLEVFTVTSCVDVGGGALASLLTECPKLRVLAVHKSLARDVELLEGLGVDSDSLPSPTSPLGAILPDTLPSPSRKQIVSPLERLELGSTQLTSTGIAEILRGVSRTLRFLVLEPRYFKEALLRDVIVPLCKKLEGLHFDDPDHYYQHQLQQSRMQRQRRQQQNLDQQQPPHQIQSPSVNSIPVTMEAENRRPKKRYFKLRRSRRPTATERSPLDTSIACKDGAAAALGDDVSSYPRPSPWLGETSTAEWVEHGNCALWAASAVGPTAGFEANGGLISNGNGATGHSHSMSGSRGRGMSSFFRGIGTRLSSILSPRNNTNGNQEDVSAPENTAGVATDNECDIDRILARFGLAAAEVDMLRQVLAPTLKSFVVMQADLLPVAESKPITSSRGSLAEGDVVLVDDALEELSKEEANMRLAVVLTVMAVYGSLVTLAAALSNLPAEGSEPSAECM